ncbi:MAG: hypothetical protein AB1512_21895 [Thermodesulfobacteriota bacterium]
MDSRFRKPLLLLGLCLVTLVLVPRVEASAPIAKITAFKGEVLVLSGTEFVKVTQAGVPLNEGDKVQTKEGDAEITFMDGAVLKMSAHSSSMIEEREEESGWWIFKSKEAVRRVTVFVGKLWFKSGASPRKNYLQTPTAVCGLRGSESEIGFDNVRNFLNVISGGSDTIGEFVRGVFENPGIDAATKNALYNALIAAQQAYNTAQQTGNTLDKAKAELSGLEAIKSAAQALQNNPDAKVADSAKQALTATEQKIDETKKKIDAMPTTVGATTTSVGATTTSVVGETTTVAEITTTAPPITTVIITFPITTTTTSVASPTK